MEFRRLLEDVKRWFWLAAVVTAVSVLAAALISCFLIDTVYEASTTIMIRSQNMNASSSPDAGADEGLVKTYINLLQSDLIIQHTIDDLKLPADVKKLRTRIKIEAVQGTGFIKVTAGDDQPEIARKISNTLVSNLQVTATDINLAGAVTVIDIAGTPIEPARPKLLLNLFIAAAAGLMSGTTLAIFLENMDGTVKGLDICVKDNPLPLIGAVPRFSKSLLNGSSGLDNLLRNEESYKIIRTKVNFFCTENPRKVILITSPIGSEGKTLTAVNLAVSFGQLGKKVLLIDGNMRNPCLQTIFNLKSIKGLPWLLTHEDKVPLGVRSTQEKNLDVIVCGQETDNPTEILESGELSNIIEFGRTNYDMVFIDCPPTLSFADTSIIARQADAAILVVQYRKTTVRRLEEASESLMNSGADILGVVVNKMHSFR